MKKQILILFVAFLSATSFAQTAKHSNVKDKLAIQGYDVVAYFESSKAIEGKKEITSEYNGAIYYFSSESNKVLFLKNPDYYLPQFGGFCAYGMSEGYEAPVKPEAFTIVNNKLYLNYNLKVKELWVKEQAARIEKATVNWEKIKKE
jgi:YHS domain-containing protein